MILQKYEKIFGEISCNFKNNLKKRKGIRRENMQLLQKTFQKFYVISV